MNNFLTIAFHFSAKTPNFAFGEDRMHLNNVQKKFDIVLELHYLCML